MLNRGGLLLNLEAKWRPAVLTNPTDHLAPAAAQLEPFSVAN
jgi:hypothetical protein